MLVNTLALSKLWFLSNIFHFQSWLEKNIHQIIFKYIWNNKPEPIKREIIFLQTNKGGLRLLHPKTQNEALRLKFLLQVTNPENKDTWVYFARYWLASKLTKYNITEWSFLQNNQIPKQNIGPMPDQYQNLFNVFEKHHNKITKIKIKTTKSISQTLKEAQQPIEIKSF